MLINCKFIYNYLNTKLNYIEKRMGVWGKGKNLQTREKFLQKVQQTLLTTESIWCKIGHKDNCGGVVMAKTKRQVVQYAKTPYVIFDLGEGVANRFELYDTSAKKIVKKSNNPLTFDKFMQEVYADCSDSTS